MAGDQRFEFDSLQDNKSIQIFLKSLLEGFEKQKIILTSENEEIVLHPDTILRFTVKAKKKDNAKNQLSIKISWKEPNKESGDEARTIKICSEA